VGLPAARGPLSLLSEREVLMDLIPDVLAALDTVVPAWRAAAIAAIAISLAGFFVRGLFLGRSGSD
jgi:hypothetical protein